MSIKLSKHQCQVVEKAKTTPIAEMLNADSQTIYCFVNGGGISSHMIRRLIDQ